MIFERIVEASGYCGKCYAQVPVRKPAVRHWPHLLLTILTGGLWLIAWLLDIRQAKNYKWRCLKCGKGVYKIMSSVEV